MTATDALALVRQILGWIGFGLAIAALAKLAGIQGIPLRAGTQEIALVAIACLLAR